MAQNPGTVIFLGDLMDGGREWDDKKFVFTLIGLMIGGYVNITDFGGCSLVLKG